MSELCFVLLLLQPITLLEIYIIPFQWQIVSLEVGATMIKEHQTLFAYIYGYWTLYKFSICRVYVIHVTHTREPLWSENAS